MFFLTEIQIKLNANAALLSPNSKKVLFQSLWGGLHVLTVFVWVLSR